MAKAPSSLSSAVAGADARAEALKLADKGDFEDDAILAWFSAHELNKGRLTHLVIGDALAEPLPVRASAKALPIKTPGDADALLKSVASDPNAMAVFTRLAHKPGSGLKAKASNAEVLANISAQLITGAIWAVRPARGVRRGGSPITADLIRLIMPHAGGKADLFVEPLNAAMTAHGIASDEQRAAFLAQVAVETADLQFLEERLNYDAAGLLKNFPTHFTPKEAVAYAHKREAIANRAYADRMGNGSEAKGDGYKYRGRGVMMTTGRDGYRAVGHELDPDSLTNPTVGAETGAQFWEDNGLNDDTAKVLNRKEFNAVTQVVNGGQIGAAERWAAYLRALDAFGIAP